MSFRLDLVKTPGKRGQLVPVLLTPEIKKAMDILIETREFGNIHPENPYIFARYSPSLQHTRGWDVLHTAASSAALDRPELVTSTRLRKHIATVCQIIDMNENEVEWLAFHMGHSIKVHRDFYRLQSSVLEMAKVGKLLCAVDGGEIHNYANKSLSEISREEIPVVEENEEEEEEEEEPPNNPSESEPSVETSADTSVENQVSSSQTSGDPHKMEDGRKGHSVQQQQAHQKRWAELRRDLLRQQNSSLEFKLHRLQFIELIQRGASYTEEILLYARRLAPFADQHPKEFQILMGSLLFLNQGLQGSPYEHLLEPINLLEICDVFVQDACTLLGLSVESPLTVSLAAGCKSLPSLLNIMQVMQSSSVMWSAKEELPIEIDVGASSLYHSIFACPILRQQTTRGNPPMRLYCGHAISRESLNKLVNGNKIKCPLCPVESSPDDAKQLYM